MKKSLGETVANVYFMFYCTCLALALTCLVLGCPPGTQTAAEFTVKVSADLCKEDTSGPSSPENVTLSCPKVEGGGTVRIVFPRKEWWAIKIRTREPFLKPDPGK